MPEEKKLSDKLDDLVFEASRKVNLAHKLRDAGLLTREEVEDVIDEVRDMFGLDPLKGRKAE